MNVLLTDYLTIATAGPTADNREIPEQWFRDIVETYDRNEYPAVLNVEHWGGNLGSVWDVRLGKDQKNRYTLEARIRPNKYFLQQNAEGHRLRFSIEVMENFAKTGKAYLTGLATTDSPASLGTTEVHFKRDDVVRSNPVELDLSAKDTETSGVFDAVSSALKKIFSNSNNPSTKTEENNMDAKEIAAAVVEAMKPVLTEVFSKQIPAQEPDAPAGENESDPELKRNFEALRNEVAELKQKFAEYSAPAGKTAPASNAPANEEPLI